MSGRAASSPPGCHRTMNASSHRRSAKCPCINEALLCRYTLLRQSSAVQRAPAMLLTAKSIKAPWVVCNGSAGFQHSARFNSAVSLATCDMEQ